MRPFFFALLFPVMVWSQTPSDRIYARAFPADSIAFYSMNSKTGNPFRTFENLNRYLKQEGQSLQFAMNGGMFMKDYSPLGLYMEDGKTQRPMNTVDKAHGNFYLQPNGVFAITWEGEGLVTKRDDFDPTVIRYATQSGPMLVINGVRHPALKEGSSNLHIRNGVGILPDGRVLFAISTERINFYDFAGYFIENGCQNALYLDGFVSRVYDPENGYTDDDDSFGVILAVPE